MAQPQEPVEKHIHHLGQYHGHLAGHNNATARDHDYLSQIRVIPTNSGKDIISVPVPMTIKSQLGNPVPSPRSLTSLCVLLLLLLTHPPPLPPF